MKVHPDTKGFNEHVRGLESAPGYREATDKDIQSGLKSILASRRTTGETYLLALALKLGDSIFSGRPYDEAIAYRAERRRKKASVKKSRRANRR